MTSAAHRLPPRRRRHVAGSPIAAVAVASPALALGLRVSRSVHASRLLGAAMAAAFLGACAPVTNVNAPATTYVVEQDAETAPGQHLVTAIAACEDGDQVLGGGCSFGEVTEPGDPPLRAVVAAPDEGGFTCTGQNTGVGVELKTVRATAVCLAGGAS